MQKLLLLMVAMSGITFVDSQQQQVTEGEIDGTQALSEGNISEIIGLKTVEHKEITYKPAKEEPAPEIVIDMVRVEEQREQRRLKEEQERVEAERIEAEKKAEEERLAKEKAEQERIKAEQVVAVEQPEAVPVAEEPVAIISVDSTLLAQIVHAEANGEPYNGKVAVAEVILNRTRSGEFPNTVEGVIYQAGQFSPVANGAINNSPTSEDYSAVQEALNGSSYAGGALYFYNPAIATSRWLDTLPVKVVIGSHHFK